MNGREFYVFLLRKTFFNFIYIFFINIQLSNHNLQNYFYFVRSFVDVFPPKEHESNP